MKFAFLVRVVMGVRWKSRLRNSEGIGCSNSQTPVAVIHKVGVSIIRVPRNMGDLTVRQLDGNGGFGTM